MGAPVPQDDLPINTVPSNDLPDAIAPVKSTLTDVFINAANKGIASLPDALLNTPTHIINLAKAAVGTAAGMAGRPDLMPGLTPNPDLARKGMESTGLINPNVRPEGMVQKAVDYGVQGAVGGALTGGAGLPRVVAGAALGGLSGEAAGVTQEVTGSPALAATAGLLPAGAGAFRNPQKDAAAMSRNAVADDTLARARAAGYVVPPSAVGGSFVGNRVEGVGGKAAIGQEASVRNQEITNKIARQEAGLKPNDPISPTTLKMAREDIGEPYREVAALDPRAKLSLERMQEARGEAKLQWDHYKASKLPSALKDAQALDAKAGMYETVIEKIAARKGDPDLMNRVRDARERFAKNYAIDNAVNVGSGDVDAHVIGRMLDKRKPLSDGLETIGRFANSFSGYSREGVKGPGISKLESFGALAAEVAGSTHGIPGLSMAVLAAPPAARSFMLSPTMQGQRQYGPGILSQAAPQTSPIVTQGILADILRRQQ